MSVEFGKRSKASLAKCEVSPQVATAGDEPHRTSTHSLLAHTDVTVMLYSRRKLPWSFVTLGSGDDEGYGDIRFIARHR